MVKTSVEGADIFDVCEKLAESASRKARLLHKLPIWNLHVHVSGKESSGTCPKVKLRLGSRLV